MPARADDADETVLSPFYIPSTAAIATQYSHVLKQSDSFAVLDPFGDIQAIGPTLEGLFFEDTRYLARLALTVDGVRPLLLSSTVTEDNAMLSSDLTNPDLVEGGRLRLPRDTVHILRSTVLGDDALFQMLELRNFGTASTEFRLGLIFDADFADMFEVRGSVRPRRGDRLPDEQGAAGPVLLYRGLDGVTRETAFEFAPSPASVGAHAVQWAIDLPPDGTQVIRIAMRCTRDGYAPRAKSYEASLFAAAGRVADRKSRAVDIYTSNESFNDWLNRSRADLDMLVSETPQGLYAYAGIPWFSTTFGGRNAPLPRRQPGNDARCQGRCRARQDLARDAQGRDGGARRGAVRALLRQHRFNAAFHHACRRLLRPHRRSRSRPRAVAEHRSRARLDDGIRRHRWRRLPRI